MIIPEVGPYKVKFDETDGLSVDTIGNGRSERLTDLSKEQALCLGRSSIIVIITVAASTGICRWVNHNGRWYWVCTPGFSIQVNEIGEDIVYDQDNIEVEPDICDIADEYKSLQSIDTITLTEVFGSHYVIVCHKGRCYKVYLPH
jgi:hypothetical protein